MRKHSLMFRGAAAAACTGLIATMWACSGDDTTAVGDDGGGSTSSSSSSSGSGSSSSGGHGSSSSSSSSSGGSSSSGSSSGSSGSSSGTGDAGHDGGSSSSSSGASSSSGSSGSSGADGGVDGSREAASDAAVDSTVGDATVEGGGDATTADATKADASDATAADAGRLQLEWCPWLDYTFGIGPNPDAGADAGICATQTPSSGVCADRSGVWANAGVGIAGDFLNSVSSDCRTTAMAGPPVITSAEAFDYGNQVTVWTLAFFGCPDPSADPGPFNGFGLIPKPLSGHAFTTADVQLLEDMFVAGINQALSDNGSSTLTVDQTTQVRASLVSWATAVMPTTSSAYSYSDMSTCAPDGGTIGDASADDGATDGGTEGGTEGGTDAGGG